MPEAPPIAVAMSGGVDSSTVAALLARQGRPVVGLTMQLWNQRRLPEIASEGGGTGRGCPNCPRTVGCPPHRAAAARSTTCTTPAASPNRSAFRITW